MNEMWSKCKEWWLQLAFREKQAVLWGVAALMIFIGYQWIFSPYFAYIDTMRKQISTGQKTLTWMQEADQAISQMERETPHQPNVTSPVMMLSQMKNQVNQAGLMQYLTQLKQVTGDSVEMHFEKVEFDKFIRLLITTVKQTHVSILQMSVIAESTPGFVNVEMTLKAG